MLYDISPLIDSSLAVWPGDVPPERQILTDLSRGDPVTLSALRSTVHLGAHADAPSHVARHGRSIERQPLESYLGPCRVVRVTVPPGAALDPRVIPHDLAEERILFTTGSFPDPRRFNRDFASLSVDLIEELARRGVGLVGTDAPSVDPFDSRELPAHHACLANGIAILEGLLLHEVPEGVYELIALPLRLAGFDASPVRAVLRTFPGEAPGAGTPRPVEDAAGSP